jgi:regulator of protease activity HflC (stomatin/prohibitin superfamily)
VGSIIAKVLMGAVGLFALTVVLGSFYTIDQSERGVLLRNGAFVEVVQPGLHFKTPLVESIYKIDMQTHTTAWKDMESYSADQQPAHMKVSVTWHVAPDKVADIYSRFGGDVTGAINRLVSPHVPEQTKVVFGQYTAQNAISKRGALNIDASEALRNALKYDPVFIVDSVQVEDIAFSPDYIKSVEARMQAEVEVQKREQQLKQEQVQAKIVATTAEGEANATRARAQADSDATRLRGAADAAAIQAKGEALVKYPALIQLTTAERWNGQLPTTMVPSGGVPMLDLRGTGSAAVASK